MSSNTVGIGISPIRALPCGLACGLYRRWGITPRLEVKYLILSQPALSKFIPGSSCASICFLAFI